MNEFYTGYRYGEPGGSKIGAWLYWLRAWLLCFARVYDEAGRGLALAAQSEVQMGRHDRRLDRHFSARAVPAARDLLPFYSMLPRGLTPTQFMERLCALSGLGRISVYRLQFWGNALRRRAALTCYDHGWWRAPAGGPRALREPASMRPP